MGKALPQVGHLHIMGGMANFPFMIWFADLDQTVGMAEVIADGLLAFWAAYESGELFRQPLRRPDRPRLTDRRHDLPEVRHRMRRTLFRALDAGFRMGRLLPKPDTPG